MPRASRAAGRASCCSCHTSTGSASNASWRSSASIPAPIGSGSSSTTAGATPAPRSAGPMVSRRSRCRPTAPNSTRRSAGSRRCAGSSPTPSSTLWMTSKPLSPKPFGPIGRTPPSSSAWSAIHGGAVPWQARTPTVLNQHESRVMAQNAYDTIPSQRYQFYAAKDREMAREADFGLMIWDGKSAGTTLNVLRLVRAGKIAVLFNVPEKKVFNFKVAADWGTFLDGCSLELRNNLRERATPEEWMAGWVPEQESFLDKPETGVNEPESSMVSAEATDKLTADINAALA